MSCRRRVGGVEIFFVEPLLALASLLLSCPEAVWKEHSKPLHRWPPKIESGGAGGLE